MGRLAAQPDRLMRAQADLFSRYMDLWQSAARRAGRRDRRPRSSQPAAGDKRFADPGLDRQPGLRRDQAVLPAHLRLAERAGRPSVEGVEPLTKRRVEFFTKMLTDAFSPSNFLLSNPAALREAIADQRREPGQGHGELRRRPGARRRPAVDQPDRLRPSSRSARTSPPRPARWSSRTS